MRGTHLQPLSSVASHMHFMSSQKVRSAMKVKWAESRRCLDTCFFGSCAAAQVRVRGLVADRALIPATCHQHTSNCRHAWEQHGSAGQALAAITGGTELCWPGV